MTASSDTILIRLNGLSHHYGQRLALDQVSLEVGRGEIFGFLGPNGGGKTTLFHLLTTLRTPQSGSITLDGISYGDDWASVRARIGCVFQHPALDKKLKVAENLRHQGRLYGLCGAALEERIRQLLDRFGLLDRADSMVQDLSGGLQRRVEIAKALLHRPQVLLMDEPSTGLDPGIRMELWDYYERLRREEGITLMMTTHLLEEAERCDRIAILDQGRMVVQGAPMALRTALGGRILRLEFAEAAAWVDRVRGLTAHPVEVRGREVAVRLPEGSAEEAARLVREFEGVAESVHLARPTLADVYQAKVGRVWNGGLS